MALSDFFNRGKIRQLESQMQALINRVQYEWWVNNGVANYMVDDPHEYLTKGYQSNASVYGIINHINNMRKQALFRLVDENKQGKKRSGKRRPLDFLPLIFSPSLFF